MDMALGSYSGTALLVVDMQNDVVANAYQAAEVANRIAGLVARARQSSVPVIWVRHSGDDLVAGSDGWQIVPALTPAIGERIVEKHFGDSFEGTDLESVLVDYNVTHLVVCGAQSDACVISTLFGGFVRGYSMTLVSDAHTTDDYSVFGAPPVESAIAYINMIWQYRSAPGRTADVVAASEVVF